MHGCICGCVSGCVRAYAGVCMHLQVCVCAYVCVCICGCVRASAGACMRMRVRSRVSARRCVCRARCVGRRWFVCRNHLISSIGCLRNMFLHRAHFLLRPSSPWHKWCEGFPPRVRPRALSQAARPSPCAGGTWSRRPFPPPNHGTCLQVTGSLGSEGRGPSEGPAHSPHDDAPPGPHMATCPLRSHHHLPSCYSGRS